MEHLCSLISHRARCRCDTVNQSAQIYLLIYMIKYPSAKNVSSNIASLMGRWNKSLPWKQINHHLCAVLFVGSLMPFVLLLFGFKNANMTSSKFAAAVKQIVNESQTAGKHPVQAAYFTGLETSPDHLANQCQAWEIPSPKAVISMAGWLLTGPGRHLPLVIIQKCAELDINQFTITPARNLQEYACGS